MLHFISEEEIVVPLTAWIISVSKGSGSGLMFKSSNSKRTAILVISISSSAHNKTSCKQDNFLRYFHGFLLNNKEIDLPRRRGCNTASERRLITVSRPFTSADTAYIVVSLQAY